MNSRVIMLPRFHTRLTIFLLIAGLHVAALWAVFVLMPQLPALLPAAAPMVTAQLLQQQTPQPTPPSPEPKREPAPKPVPKPRVQPAPKPTLPVLPPSERAPTLAPAPQPIAPAAAPVAAAPAPAATSAAPSVAEPAAIVAPRFNAAYLNNPPPAYPPLLRRIGEEGKVLLRVYVTAEGNAGEVNIQSSSGSPLFDDAALVAVRKWRFVPARQGTAAVGAWVQVPISFKLR